MQKRNKVTPRLSGEAVENAAREWLQQRGLRYVRRNYRCKMGEIDLVMMDREVLVFVEVRFRRHQHFGGGAASVDRKKQQKLLRTAQHYLATHRSHGQLPCRFDVLAATLRACSGEAMEWQWIKNAFGQ